MDCIGKKRTVDIPLGEFMKIHGLLDIAEVKGRYDIIFFRGSKLRRGRAVDSSHEGCWIYTYIVYRGFID